MNLMGRSIGSLNQRLAALRAQREWIPASNRAAIREATREIDALEAEIRGLENHTGGRLQSWFNDLKSSIPIVGAITNPLAAISMAAYKMFGYLKGSIPLYNAQNEAEKKLFTVMRNTMGASRMEFNDILALTSAQQALGVIGDEVQLAGAQELATYLGESESLKRVIPVMNDMLAQQYGLNVTQEQAVTIATMLGKVLQGQILRTKPT
jgi:hypothetical protein